MPIGKDEFNSGRTQDTIEGQILSLLKGNRNNAFSSVEIMSSLGYIADIKDFWSTVGFIALSLRIDNALNTLIKEGSVKAKKVKQKSGVEETYYMAT